MIMTSIYIETKTKQAKEVMRQCMGEGGVWAGIPRYLYQCWTRDFVTSLPTLIEFGYEKEIEQQFATLAKKQKHSGQMPILYLDNTPAWLLGKIKKSIEHGKLSFMLKRFFHVETLTPWTTDSEILYVNGVLEYGLHKKGFSTQYGDSIKKALQYIDDHVIGTDGLAYGGDWRDTMSLLEKKAVLTNNCLLYRMYHLLGEEKKAQTLKERINKDYWAGSYYTDYPETERFDMLGQAYALLFGIVPEKRYAPIIEKYKQMETLWGYKMNDVPPNPITAEEKHMLATTSQYEVIWPFVHGFVIQSLVKMGVKKKALQEYEKWTQLDGFYEWYSPKNGKGYGCPIQLWSAALFLQTKKVLYA